jgi:serine/threonine protein kinase
MINISLIAGLASTGTVILLIILAWLLYRKRTKGAKQSQEYTPGDGDMDDAFKKGTGPRRFTYKQLSKATWGFSDDWKLGEGGFGSVYRGFLEDEALHVAIKRVSKTSRQGRREYVSEVTIISRLRHRNLVQLVGWCHEGDELLLVYELMSNGSLDTHLYGTGNVLTWPVRYNIILGMGSALLYLHQEWEQCVVHRDIKPSNVMLDASFAAKLGDFGLARLVDHARAARTTMVAGTKGYIDPECAVTFRATTRSDVYSFGVVLLEVACGRKPVIPEEEDEGKVLLVRWVWELYGSGDILAAADARLLDGGGELDELERAMVVGLWCVHPDSAARPSIRQAMSVLQLEAPMPELPLEMPVATYGPPGVGGGSYQWSNATTSSSGRSGSSRGQTMTSEAEASVHSSSASNSYHTGTAHSSVDPTGELTYSSGNQSNSGCSRVSSQDSGIM